MSAIVHPIAFLDSFNIHIKSYICPSFKSASTIITGKVLFWLNNKYHKWDERALNSNFGGLSIDGFAGECLSSSIQDQALLVDDKKILPHHVQQLSVHIH